MTGRPIKFVRIDFAADELIIPDTDTIWIIGAGPTLDLLDRSLIKDHIVITCNSAISSFKPTYAIAFDTYGVEHAAKWSRDDTIWIAREKTIEQHKRFNLNYYVIEQLMEREPHGCGLEAYYFAYYLCYYQKAIKNICHVGFDEMDYCQGNKRFYYANCLTLLKSQTEWKMPKNWQASDYSTSPNNHSSYNCQRRFIVQVKEKLINELGINIISYSHDNNGSERAKRMVQPKVF